MTVNGRVVGPERPGGAGFTVAIRGQPVAVPDGRVPLKQFRSGRLGRLVPGLVAGEVGGGGTASV